MNEEALNTYIARMGRSQLACWESLTEWANDHAELVPMT